MPDSISPRTVAILGAGPVGLAAAAHVLERGMEPVVLEAGPQAGHAIRQWAHVHMFSPWEYNIDKAAGRLLAQAGWTPPDLSTYPTGGELVARNRSAGDVVDALRPYYKGAIVVRDDAFAAWHVSGIYDLRDPVKTLRELAASHGATVRQITPWLLLVTAD